MPTAAAMTPRIPPGYAAPNSSVASPAGAAATLKPITLVNPVSLQNSISGAASVRIGTGTPKGSSEAVLATGQTSHSAMLADDRVAGADLAARLAADPLLRGAQISVAIRHSVVSLNGFVLTAQQSVRAQQVAQTVAGVGLIRNGLSLKR